MLPRFSSLGIGLYALGCIRWLLSEGRCPTRNGDRMWQVNNAA